MCFFQAKNFKQKHVQTLDSREIAFQIWALFGIGLGFPVVVGYRQFGSADNCQLNEFVWGEYRLCWTECDFRIRFYQFKGFLILFDFFSQVKQTFYFYKM
jgi:hypothetical protein